MCYIYYILHHNAQRMKNIEIAKNLGFMRKMNKGTRSPMNDIKFLEEFGETLTVRHIKSWLQGWDEANMEYTKASKCVKN